jgi:3-oxoadipate enol-lactonase
VPTATLNGTPYAYIDECLCPPTHPRPPLVVFGHGLLAGREMFRAQIDALKDRYRCVSLDWPGHGDTGFAPGGWTMWDMGRDAAALVEELGEEQAIFAGLSQGGMAFMRLAIERPAIVRALILMDTSSGPEDPAARPMYEQLSEGLLHGDEATRSALMDTVQTILFGAPWRAREPEALAREKVHMLAHDRQGQYLAARAVFDRDDVTERLGEIRAPTLVLCGTEDTATVPDRARALAERIPGAELQWIEGAGHHSALEEPEAVTRAIEAFLARVAPARLP